jgi:hypothetical protein
VPSLNQSYIMYRCTEPEFCPLRINPEMVPGPEDQFLEWLGPACEHLLDALPHSLPKLESFAWVMRTEPIFQSTVLVNVIFNDDRSPLFCSNHFLSPAPAGCFARCSRRWLT